MFSLYTPVCRVGPWCPFSAQGSEYYFNLFNWLMDDQMLGFSKRFISLNEADGGIKMISLCNSWIANYRNYCFNLRFPLCGFKALPSLNHKK